MSDKDYGSIISNITQSSSNFAFEASKKIEASDRGELFIPTAYKDDFGSIVSIGINGNNIDVRLGVNYQGIPMPFVEKAKRMMERIDLQRELANSESFKDKTEQYGNAKKLEDLF